MASAAISVLKIVGAKLQEAKKKYDQLKATLESLEKTITALEELVSDRSKLESIGESGIQHQLQHELKHLSNLLDEVNEQTVSRCGGCGLFAGALVGQGAAKYNKKFDRSQKELQSILDIASEQVNVAQLAALEDLAGGVPGKVILHPGAKQFWRQSFGLDRMVTCGLFADSVETAYNTDIRRTFQDMRQDLRRGLIGQLDPSQDGNIEAQEFAQFVENSGAAQSKNLDFFDIVVRSACAGSLATTMTIAHCAEIRAVAVHENFVATADVCGFVKVWMHLDGSVCPQMNSAVGAVQDQVTFLKFVFHPEKSLQVYAASRNIVILGAFTGNVQGVIREPHVSQVTGMDVDGDYTFTYAKYPSMAAHVFKRDAETGEYFKCGNIGGAHSVIVLHCVKDGRHVVVQTSMGVAVWDYKALRELHTLNTLGCNISSIALHYDPESTQYKNKFVVCCALKKKNRCLVFTEPLNEKQEPQKKALAWKNEDFPRSHFTPFTQIATGFGPNTNKIKIFKHNILEAPVLDDEEFNKDSKGPKHEIIISGARVSRLCAGESIGAALVEIDDAKVGKRGGFVVLDFNQRPDQVPTILGTMGAWAMHSLPTTDMSIAVPWCLAKHHLFPLDNHGTLLSACKSATLHVFGGANNILCRRSLSLTHMRDELKGGRRRQSFVDAEAATHVSPPPMCSSAMISAMCGLKKDNDEGDVHMFIGFSDGKIIKQSFCANEVTTNEATRQLVYTSEAGKDKEGKIVLPSRFFKDNAAASWVDECNAYSVFDELRAFAMSVVGSIRLGDSTGHGRTVVRHIDQLYNVMQRAARNMLPKWPKFISQNKDNQMDDRLLEELLELLEESFEVWTGIEEVEYAQQEEKERMHAPPEPDEEDPTMTEEQAEKKKKEDEKQKKKDKEKAKDPKEQRKKKILAKKDAKEHAREQSRKWAEVVHPVGRLTEDGERTPPIRYEIHFKSNKIPFTNFGAADSHTYQFIDPEAWRHPAGVVSISNGRHECSECATVGRKKILDPVEHVWQVCKACAAKRPDIKSCISCGGTLPISKPRHVIREGNRKEKTEDEEQLIDPPKWAMCNGCYDKQKEDRRQMILGLAASKDSILAGAVDSKHFRYAEGRGDLIHLNANTLQVNQRIKGVFQQGYRNIVSTEDQGGLFAVSIFPRTIAIINDTERNMADDFIGRIEYGKFQREVGVSDGHIALALSLAKSIEHKGRTLLFFDISPKHVAGYYLSCESDDARSCTYTALGDPTKKANPIPVGGSGIGALNYGGNPQFPVLIVGTNDGMIKCYSNVESTDPEKPVTHVISVQLHRFDVITDIFFTQYNVITACNNGTYGRIPISMIFSAKKKFNKKNHGMFLLEELPLPGVITNQHNTWRDISGDWVVRTGDKSKKLIGDGEVEAFALEDMGMLSTACVPPSKTLTISKHCNQAVIAGDGNSRTRGRDLLMQRFEDGQMLDAVPLVQCSRLFPMKNKANPGDKPDVGISHTLRGDSPPLILQFCQKKGDVGEAYCGNDGRDGLVRLCPMTVGGGCYLRVKPKGAPDAHAKQTVAPISGMITYWFEFKSFGAQNGEFEITLIPGAGQKPDEVMCFFYSVCEHKDKDVAPSMTPALFVTAPLNLKSEDGEGDPKALSTSTGTAGNAMSMSMEPSPSMDITSGNPNPLPGQVGQ